MEDPTKDDDSAEFVGLGCALEYFSERDEVLEMITNLRNIYTQKKPLEVAYQRFNCILSLYQEQPHLLDPHLSSILNTLIGIVRNKDEPHELKHEAFKYLHVIVKVRGYKVVVRYLPHEVSDMEPVLTLLEEQDPGSHETWETRYALLLWLSIIVMIPFHMSRLDSFDVNEASSSGNGKNKKTVIERLSAVCKQYVLAGDSSRFPAALLVARFFTRNDVKEQHLGAFLEWACQVVNSRERSLSEQCGALAGLAAILKHGDRDDLLPHARNLLQWLQESQEQARGAPLLAQLSVKVVQRIGLTFLPVRVAAWRYQRGSRSLSANLNAGDAPRSPVVNPTFSQLPPQLEDRSEDIDVPGEIEEVIEKLIQGLRDPNTIVRWSAAKGIGRVTGRLPKDLADEVVGSVLELFSARETDSGWHGGCLALAELAKRGLLLPQRLDEVIPLVLKALTYDETRGYVSVGSHIRDAACYVCWAFARAYDTEVLRPYVNDIAGALVVVTVFDREINCRRAASAAFQEHVGRQGTFSHGIDILTTADYFTVSVRSHAYLNISAKIAEFEEYAIPLISHLVEKKVDHWDLAIRELTAKALHNLTPRAPQFMAMTVLPKLLEQTKSIDLNARHGAVLAVAGLLPALAETKEIEVVIGADAVDRIRGLVPHFRERGQLGGLGGELMKQACAVLIEKASAAKMPFHQQSVIGEWEALLDLSLKHEVAAVRTRAASALPVFFTEFYQGDAKTAEQQQTVVDNYISNLSANSETTRMGFCLAIGSLPAFMLHGRIGSVVGALIQCSQKSETTATWSESRRDAIKALQSIATTLGVTASDDPEQHLKRLNRSQVAAIYGCFLQGVSEYTMDRRGDIGAWVREAAMTGLQVLTSLVVNTDPTLVSSSITQKMMEGIAQQAVERIDRTRAHAGRVFSNLLHSEPAVPHIAHHKRLLEIFPLEVCRNELNWNSAADTFPLFIQLLGLEPYTHSVMLGLIASVGGLSESLVKYSSVAFFAYVKGLQDQPDELSRLCDVIVLIVSQWLDSERLSESLLVFLDRLLGSGVLRTVLTNLNSTFASEIFRLLKNEIAKMREISRLNRSIDVLCQLVQVPGDISQRALTQLFIFLCHRFPVVRKTTATNLYEALMLYADDAGLDPTAVETAMAMLSDVEWDQPADTLRPTRNEICTVLGLTPPRLMKVNPNSASAS